MRTRPAAGVAGALCVLLSLTGCGVAPTSAASSAPVGTGSSSVPPASGSASASASVEPTGPVGVRYGTTYRWPDGLRVRVGFGVKKTTGISVTIVRGPGFAEVRFTG